MWKVGITGGIGSGKTTVSKILESMGVCVYDSDTRAKVLMDRDSQVVESLFRLFGPQAYLETSVNRPYIASLVFSDESLMQKLNAIVHPAVYRDFEAWLASEPVRRSASDYAVLESAILIETGWNQRMDSTVVVTAPEALRIERVMQRNEMPEELVRMRIQAQMTDQERLPFADYVLSTDESQLLIPQIEKLHQWLTEKAAQCSLSHPQ